MAVKPISRLPGVPAAPALSVVLTVVVLAVAVGCGGTTLPERNPILVSFSDMPSLTFAREGHYSLFAVVGGKNLLVGSFQVDDRGRLRSLDGGGLVGFESFINVSNASSFLISIEPDSIEVTRATTRTPRAFAPTAQGFDLAPTFPFMTGTVAPGSRTVSLSLSFTFAGVSRPASVYATATGVFVVATPTESPADRSLGGKAGVWFIEPGSATQGLILPPLSLLYSYRAWLVTAAGPLEIGGLPVDPTSLTQMTNPGRFPDDFGVYSDTRGLGSADDLLRFPGEDFLGSSPDPLAFKFPLSVVGQEVLVSIDPRPMLANRPFLRLFSGRVPSSVTVRGVPGIPLVNLLSSAGGARIPRGTLRLP